MAEEADKSLDVLRSRCQEELLSNKLKSSQAQATESDLILEFRKQRLYLFSFPLEVGKGRSASQFASALPGGFVDVDGEILVLARRALRLLRTRTATLAASDVGMGSIRDIQTDEVELLTGRTEVAVAFGKIGEAATA